MPFAYRRGAVKVFVPHILYARAPSKIAFMVMCLDAVQMTNLVAWRRRTVEGFGNKPMQIDFGGLAFSASKLQANIISHADR